MVPSATVTFDRSAYSRYSDVGRAEEFTDTNGDGTCNENEPFVDANGNGSWDQSRELSDSNGARDAVLYEVNASYDRPFPMAELIGFEDTVTVTARTVLRNQPFNSTADVQAVGNCV